VAKKRHLEKMLPAFVVSMYEETDNRNCNMPSQGKGKGNVVEATGTLER